jgi:hypothetical protein
MSEQDPHVDSTTPEFDSALKAWLSESAETPHEETEQPVEKPIPSRELAYRVNDGIHVVLLWEPSTDRKFVSVDDAKTGESFEVDIKIDMDPMDVFKHPYAYAAYGASRRGALALKGLQNPDQGQEKTT